MLERFLVVGTQPINEIGKMFADALEFIPTGDMAAAVRDDGQGFILRGDREEFDVFQTGANAILDSNRRTIEAMETHRNVRRGESVEHFVGRSFPMQ